MKKIFLSIVVAASFGFFTACSEDESEPTLEELCATGLNEDCLVGTWNLKGIESLDKSQTYTDFTPAPTVVEFTKDKENRSFSVTFTNNSILSPMAADGCGGTKTYGKWEITGASLKLTIGRADCGAPSNPIYTITPSLSVTDLYLNKVVFHENDMTDALTKANAMEHFVRVMQ
jgi:hypothetical protein